MTNVDESKSVNTTLTETGTPRLSDDIHVLEAEVAQLSLEREKIIQSIKELLAAEDPQKKISHHEAIFNAQQEKLRLDVDIKFRTNKIHRISLGVDTNKVSSGVQDGFLF